MKLILRWLITAVSLYAAVLIVPGISVDGNAWVAFTIMALVLGLVNALVRPVLKMLSCGLIILTLGLFVFVINAATFMLASWIAPELAQHRLLCQRLPGGPLGVDCGHCGLRDPLLNPD